MSHARRLVVAAFAIAMGLAASAIAQQPAQTADKSAADGDQPTMRDDKAAIDAGVKWLELIDAGKTGPRWDEASKHLKSTVTREKWISGLRDIRKPYGRLASRQPARFARAHSLPDSPDGDYAIIEYESEFANGKRAVERLVWMLEPDGIWRVSGYHIR